MEPVDPSLTHEPPRPRSTPILTAALIRRVLTNALIIVSGTLYVYAAERSDGSVTRRDTTMTFTTFVMFDMFNALR